MFYAGLLVADVLAHALHKCGAGVGFVECHCVDLVDGSATVNFADGWRLVVFTTRAGLMLPVMGPVYDSWCFLC